MSKSPKVTKTTSPIKTKSTDAKGHILQAHNPAPHAMLGKISRNSKEFKDDQIGVSITNSDDSSDYVQKVMDVLNKSAPAEKTQKVNSITFQDGVWLVPRYEDNLLFIGSFLRITTLCNQKVKIIGELDNLYKPTDQQNLAMTACLTALFRLFVGIEVNVKGTETSALYLKEVINAYLSHTTGISNVHSSFSFLKKRKGESLRVVNSWRTNLAEGNSKITASMEFKALSSIISMIRNLPLTQLPKITVPGDLMITKDTYFSHFPKLGKSLSSKSGLFCYAERSHDSIASLIAVERKYYSDLDHIRTVSTFTPFIEVVRKIKSLQLKLHYKFLKDLLSRRVMISAEYHRLPSSRGKRFEISVLQNSALVNTSAEYKDIFDSKKIINTFEKHRTSQAELDKEASLFDQKKSSERDSIHDNMDQNFPDINSGWTPFTKDKRSNKSRGKPLG